MRVVGVAGAMCALVAGCLGSPPGSIEADAGDQPDAAAATGDAAADPCAGLPELAPFTDDFSTGDLDWAIDPKIQRDGAALVEVEVAGGQLVFKPTSAGGDNAWVKSVEFDFTIGRVAVRVPSLSTDGDTEAYLAVLGPIGEQQLRYDGSHLRAPRGANLLYLPDAHLWWQIRSEGGLLHYETSDDGIDWNEFESGAAGFALDAVRMRLGVSVASAGPEERGQFAVDDLNLPPCGQ